MAIFVRKFCGNRMLDEILMAWLLFQLGMDIVAFMSLRICGFLCQKENIRIRLVLPKVHLKRLLLNGGRILFSLFVA